MTKATVAVPVVLDCHREELGELALYRVLVEEQHQPFRPVEQPISCKHISLLQIQLLIDIIID